MHARRSRSPSVSGGKPNVRKRKHSNSRCSTVSRQNKLAHKGRQYNSTLATMVQKDRVATVYLAQTGSNLAY